MSNRFFVSSLLSSLMLLSSNSIAGFETDDIQLEVGKSIKRTYPLSQEESKIGGITALGQKIKVQHVAPREFLEEVVQKCTSPYIDLEVKDYNFNSLENRIDSVTVYYIGKAKGKASYILFQEGSDVSLPLGTVNISVE